MVAKRQALNNRLPSPRCQAVCQQTAYSKLSVLCNDHNDTRDVRPDAQLGGTGNDAVFNRCAAATTHVFAPAAHRSVAHALLSQTIVSCN